jgi:hypothetical protein
MVQTKIFDFETVIEVAKKIATQPRSFYQQMAKHGGYTEPLIFAAVMGLLAGIIAAVFSMFTSGHLGSVSFGLLSILIVPVGTVLCCYVAAAIMFVIWKLMGSREDYETGFRCVAYSMVVLPVAMLAALIPYIGTILANLWWFWLMFIATNTVHNMESRKSMIVIGSVAVLFMFLNLSGEKTQRQYEARHADFNEQMDQIQNMSPEELGEAAGEFIKGLQKATEE